MGASRCGAAGDSGGDGGYTGRRRGANEDSGLGRLLYAVAAALHATSRALTRLASSLAAERTLSAPTLHLPVVEFYPVHRDAGAPEGALYVDGELVGYLPPGVTRL